MASTDSVNTSRRSPRPGETALVPPALPKSPRSVVLRPRLFDLLDEGARESGLTLISGPPGSGKTLLLTSWLRERPSSAPIAWVPLREADRASFWRQVLDALHPLVDRDALLRKLDAPPDDASPTFVEDFVRAADELERPLVLVIDDLHLASPAAIRALDRVLRAPPSELHLVVASRIDPALPLPVLRVAGDLAEIRARDLAFNELETQELFAGMNLELTEHELEIVLGRTEGWAAGLRLFALSMQTRADGRDIVERFAVDERPASEFLMAEVLAIQPPEIRLFLLRTSIVDNLDGELANELSGRRDGARVLEQLYRDNVFVERVGATEHRYRYHQLFGALLRAEASYELQEELASLHRRAAISLAARGRPGEALQHAADARQWDLVVALLCEHWSAVFALIRDDRSQNDLFTALPPPDVAASPVLDAFRALLRVASNDSRGQAALLAEARSRRDEIPETSRPGFDALVRYTSALADRARGHSTEARELATIGLERAAVEASSSDDEDGRRALGLATLGVAQLWDGARDEARATLEEALDVARRTETTPAETDALAHLALIELDAGHLRRAARIARAALELARARPQSTPAGVVARLVLALVQYEWGDINEAGAALASADAVTRRTGDVPGRVLGAIACASVALSEGGESVDDALLRLAAIRRRTTVSTSALGPRVAALEARLLAKTSRFDEANAALANTDITGGDGAVALARIQMAAGLPSEALVALGRRRNALPYVEIEASVTEAVARRSIGDTDGAAAALDLALELAENEVVRRPFIDAGSAIRDLLGAHLRRTNAQRWLAAELVARFEDRSAAEGIAPAELLEPLSDRESEVLHYLPTIMSNADIASELFVSVNTVKTHIKSIYRKLGATRRQDAVRRARHLRLL
ncbi:MAG TPA: LuxR C-terminal-related transcriptional regulator [Gaiellaceae bacterium]|nr:LuxR C-terminal-related transcriptional regulator [Gaiellaceae bacterium]